MLLFENNLSNKTFIYEKLTFKGTTLKRGKRKFAEKIHKKTKFFRKVKMRNFHKRKRGKRNFLAEIPQKNFLKYSFAIYK